MSRGGSGASTSRLAGTVERGRRTRRFSDASAALAGDREGGSSCGGASASREGSTGQSIRRHERTVRSMRVLTVYAHPNPASFCHAVLERFTRGLEDAGHTSEVVDLYAIKFNPVFGRDDYSFFAHESVPPELFDETELRRNGRAGGGGSGGGRQAVAARQGSAGAARDDREAAAEGRARPAGEGRGGGRACVHRADHLDELPGDPARLGRARLHLRLRLHDDPGGLAAG